jgi:hypothetical protein
MKKITDAFRSPEKNGKGTGKSKAVSDKQSGKSWERILNG